MTPPWVTSLFLCAIAAAHSRLNAEGDHLRPLESLPFFQGGRHSWSLTQAKRWRQNLLTRPRFHWSNPVAGTIKVFVRPPRWLKPDFGVNESCEVACDYTRSLDSAHVALSTLRPIAPRNGGVVKAIMSFEPYMFCMAGECLSLSYPRSADVQYEFLPRSSIDWAARPVPPRPAVPSSIVFISKCGYKWRMDYLLELANAGVDIKFAGACNRTFYDRRCKRSDAFSRCKIEHMSQFPFAIAFENSIHDDYVTEKWGHAWQSGAIPIYAGSPLIEEKTHDWPPFINALDFASPADLAAYMVQVLEDDTLWKHYTTRGPLPPLTRLELPRYDSRTLDDFVCDTCRALRNST